MAELTLISSRKRPLKPLVEAALNNELRLLEAGIRRTQQRLKELRTDTDFLRMNSSNALKMINLMKL